MYYVRSFSPQEQLRQYRLQYGKLVTELEFTTKEREDSKLETKALRGQLSAAEAKLRTANQRIRSLLSQLVFLMVLSLYKVYRFYF